MSYNLSLINPSSKMFDELMDIISKSAPNECVISIEKVENEILSKRFEERKKELEEKYKGKQEIKTVTVFHGSRDFNSVKNILLDGFDASFSRVAAFGIGTYFAKNYAYSKSYSGKNVDYKVMMICDILVGKKVLGNGKNNNILDEKQGDVFVDNISNPSIYSVPNNSQSIPRYVVQFY